MAATPPLEPPPLQAFQDPSVLRAEASEFMAPPIGMSVSEAAERYHFVHKPGGYSGFWSNEDTPYLVEPMNSSLRRRLSGTVFVGPAQCGKTAGLVINPIVYAVTCDQADMLVIQTTSAMARDFSKRQLSRLNRFSREVGNRLDPTKGSDNVFDKHYRGMILSLGSPTINDLSGRPIPRGIITDYDRTPPDVDGEGEPFDLLRNRAKTYGSRAWTGAESSPGRPVLNAKWKRTTPHEAPPTTGILALYNRGHRARWQWECRHCRDFFEGHFGLLKWADSADIEECAESVEMICPLCGGFLRPEWKRELNAEGIWVGDGQAVVDGRLVGDARRSDIASYWLKGPAAAFQSWQSLVRNWLTAKAECDRTGSEESLKVTVNTDQAEPYLPKAAQVESSLEAEELIERAEAYPLGVVPEGAVFLTAAVDVQANRFEILVRAWGPGMESWVVDFFSVYETENRDGKKRLINPALYNEDWDLLREMIIEKRYQLASSEGLEMAILRTVIDSGGAKGVTPRAYDFWRRCRKDGLGRRVLLSKGASKLTAPRVMRHLPDSQRKDRKAAARGEVPVFFFNADILKDELDSQLRKEEGGDLAVHLSRGLLEEKPPHPFFEQITAETRGPDGKWQKEKDRNEAVDLMVMAHVGALQAKAERIDWKAPPVWAQAATVNPYVTPVLPVAEDPEDDAPPTTAQKGRRIVRTGRRLN
ncbi:phage terminase large subunit family protein [Pelagibius sp.]|uniref:phage terminase large subunit family protein n=1 Tax=Pelagibius sp. TaxID=1931238 RepID=UPI0026082DA1|nr:terminase gpA endonuclease subunit [Pelagibius sp.]